MKLVLAYDPARHQVSNGRITVFGNPELEKAGFPALEILVRFQACQ